MIKEKGLDPMEQKYDVFISYAHADAQTEEQKKLVDEIKSSIEQALKTVSASGNDPHVFLDSEALGWGDEWSAKICRCIENCRVFVYLLSPNYLKSNYCQREKLWWAKREIARGRLNKSTRPIYYITLPEKTGDKQMDRYIKELRICQTDGKPFFNSLDEVRSEVIRDRLESVRDEVIEQVQADKAVSGSLCTVYPRLSRYFVGRLQELADLNEACYEKRTIPVITGPAGAGKSEMAVAYAYAYAENYPEGRFLIPMQGVTDWTTAMDKMVEKIRECDVEPSDWGFPGDFAKLPSEERLRAARKWLRKRAEQGRLLLVLDNLENLELISDAGLRELSGAADLPDDLRIIATSRLNETSSIGQNERKFYQVGRLSDKDALELFCLIGKNIFPFARWPMSEDGKILLDWLSPDRKRPSEREIADIGTEYAALKEIISLLGGHAWSMEVVAGLMAANPNCRFQDKLANLRERPLEELRGRTFRGGNDLQYPEILLQPTLDLLLKLDEIEKNLGRHILFLAAAAAFFPPEQVPAEALAGIWKQQFGDGELSWDNSLRKEPSSGKFALDQLKKYRIVNGDGPLLKMHRLTRAVLRARLTEDEKKNILESMRRYLGGFLSDTANPNSEQLLPWCGWAEELSEPANDNIDIVNCVASCCIKVNLSKEAESLLLKSKTWAEGSEYAAGIASCWHLLGLVHNDLNRLDQAEQEFLEALNIFRKLAHDDPGKFNEGLAAALNNLAFLHASRNQPDMAEREYLEVLTIRGQLTKDAPEKYDEGLAAALNNLANLHASRNQPDMAEREYQQVLDIYRKLAHDDPEKFNEGLAAALNNLANLHGDSAWRTMHSDRLDEAEREYQETLAIFRKLARDNPEKFNGDLAKALDNFASLHGNCGRLDEAERELSEALDIYRQLARNNPEKFNGDLAKSLNNLAQIHCSCGRLDEAERELSEALAIYRKLAHDNPGKFNEGVATTLNNLAGIYCSRNQLDEAERYFSEALAIYRHLANDDPGKFNEYLVITLNNLAEAHCNRNRVDEAEREFLEILSICRQLTKDNPDKFIEGLANTLNNLALLYSHGGRMIESEREIQELLTIRREQANDDPQKYNRLLADALFGLAIVKLKQNKRDSAKKALREAFEIRWGRPISFWDVISLKVFWVIRHWDKPHPYDIYR